MQLARTGSKTYAFLPSGILIVDPNPTLLAARSQLISAARDYVAASNGITRGIELRNMGVKVAILSQTLGQAPLEALAQEIRLCWPSACILLFGNVDVILEDRLYDDSIDDHCRPEQLLSILYRLERGDTNTSDIPRARIGSSQCDLPGAGQVSLLSSPNENEKKRKSALE